jgi:hypothetical protein
MTAATQIRAVTDLGQDIPQPTWGEDFARIRKAHYSNGTDLVTTARHYLRRATVTQMRQAMEGRSYEEAA